MTDDLTIIYTTCVDEAEARHIATTLLDEKLIACGNLLPGMISLYEWEGQRSEGREIVLLLKTRADLFEAVRQRVLQLHSYDCPCVMAIPVSDVDSAYGQWLLNGTKAPA